MRPSAALSQPAACRNAPRPPEAACNTARQCTARRATRDAGATVTFAASPRTACVRLPDRSCSAQLQKATRQRVHQVRRGWDDCCGVGSSARRTWCCGGLRARLCRGWEIKITTPGLGACELGDGAVLFIAAGAWCRGASGLRVWGGNLQGRALNLGGVLTATLTANLVAREWANTGAGAADGPAAAVLQGALHRAHLRHPP